MKRRLRRSLKRAGDAAVGAVAIGLIKALRLIPPDLLADGAGLVTRTLGPLFRENRVERDQSVALNLL